MVELIRIKKNNILSIIGAIIFNIVRLT